MGMTPEPRGFLPLTNLAFHVLLALGDGPAHGYAIGKEVERRSDGMLNPATGSLYQVLKRLSQDGLIEDAPHADDDTRRQSYRLTTLGRKVAEAEARRLSALVGAAREKRLLSGR
jgi:DNA-binding PadR family transcriptional regulator